MNDPIKTVDIERAKESHTAEPPPPAPPPPKPRGTIGGGGKKGTVIRELLEKVRATSVAFRRPGNRTLAKRMGVSYSALNKVLYRGDRVLLSTIKSYATLLGYDVKVRFTKKGS